MAKGDSKARKCSAHSKTSGQQCRQPAIPGGTVCRYHGGAAPQVIAKAAERLADLIDPDRALREAARLAYSDVTELFDGVGNLKPVNEWPAELRAAVAGVEVVRRNVDGTDGEQEDVIKLKLWDKPKALEMLFKHLGLLVEKLEVSGNVNITERLAAGRKRVAEAKGKRA